MVRHAANALNCYVVVRIRQASNCIDSTRMRNLVYPNVFVNASIREEHDKVIRTG
jgi:hypothetical protein